MASGTDEAEVAALRAGDEAAFEALIHRYHGAMLRLALAQVHDRALAEDVVQETWLTVIRGIDRFEGRSTLKTWVFGILLNIARSRRRRESRSLPFASLFRRDDSDSRGPTVDPDRFAAAGNWTSLPSNWGNVPEARLLDRETLDQVSAAISGLPSRQREVIILRDVAGWEAGEVAEFLGISAGNERVRLHRARAAVRRRLEDYLG
ncbi:MAG: sigma-70 family RNA polymerase sigma factor [Candidatus Dormibacteraceae bacterium]